MNHGKNEDKIFATLEEFIKFFVDDVSYKQDKRYICKWILYATMCRDPEEVLLYMEENKIGTEHSMLYEGLADIYEQEGDYEKAEIFLQNGLTGRARPTETMILLMKEFELRMKERLQNDFYSKGWTLTEEKTKAPMQMKNGKRLCPLSEESPFENAYDIKKFKPNEKKLSCVKIGNISIYVDEEYRQYISKSKELVREYNNLCTKYHLQRTKPSANCQKPLSWISKEVKKYKFHFKNKSVQRSMIKNEFEKNFEIYSEALIKTDGFLIGNKDSKQKAETKVLNDIKNKNSNPSSDSIKQPPSFSKNKSHINGNEENNKRTPLSHTEGGLVNFSNKDQKPNLKIPENIFEKNDFSFLKKLKAETAKPYESEKNSSKPKHTKQPAENLFLISRIQNDNEKKDRQSKNMGQHFESSRQLHSSNSSSYSIDSDIEVKILFSKNKSEVAYNENSENEEEESDDDDLSVVSKSLNFNDEVLSNYDVIKGDSSSLSMIDKITGIYSCELPEKRDIFKNSKDEIGYRSVERPRGGFININGEELGLSSVPPFFENSSMKENCYPPSAGEESGSRYYRLNGESLSLSIYQEADKENCYRIESDYKEDSSKNGRKALAEIKPSRKQDFFIQSDINSHIIVPQIVVEQEIMESHRARENLAYSIEREVKNGNPKYNFHIHEDDEFEIFFRERDGAKEK